MSDYDYGRENGLWGNDGIPYSVKYESNSYDNSSKKVKLNYSENLAVKNGFEMISDVSAYNGRYFIKEGKKWIHNIEALKRQFRTTLDSILIEHGYDVQSYHLSH